MTDERWLDPELDDLFAGEPELRSLAGRIRDARPEPRLDERFPAVLRAQLIREAEARVPAPAERAARDAPRPRAMPRRRLLPWSPAWNAAGVGIAAMAVAAIVLATTRPQDHTVTAISPVADVHAVSPDNVITVSFSQPMDHNAVVAGLHITPATEVTTSWSGNNLVITPTHHLAGNTSYTVTIDRSAARATNGSTPPAPITITFGTAPTPPPASSVATLQPTSLGPVDPHALLVAGPAGSLTAATGTAAPVAASPSASPSPRPSVLPTHPGTPVHPSPSVPTEAPSATPLPSSAGASVVRFNADGSSVSLGAASTLLAPSPDGLQLLSAVPQNGQTQVVLASTDGQQSSVLTTVDGPVLGVGWLDAATALVAESDRVEQVSLEGTTTQLAALPANTTTVRFAPVGGMLFAGATGADGQLLDSRTGQGHVLPGSRTDFAFSGNGEVVAWIDSTGSVPELMTSTVQNQAVAQVPVTHPGDVIGSVALDASGDRVAFIDQAAPAATQLSVESLQTGTLIAQGAAVASPVFLGNGTIGFLTADNNAAVAKLPTTGVSAVPELPGLAASALQAFVNAQAKGDAGAMSALAAPGVDVTTTPARLSRGYVISAVANSDGSVDATARLLVDASAAHPAATSADETLTLALNSAGTGYVVTTLHVGPLTSVSAGPHVLRVVPTLQNGKVALLVTFDSDLTVASVAPAISVTTADGAPVATTTTFDPDSRTATVLVDAPGGTALLLSVATSLQDVDGVALAGVFTVVTTG